MDTSSSMQDILVYMAIFIASVSGFVYWYFTNTANFWKNKGIPYAKPEFIFGNMKDLILLRSSISDVLLEIYNRFHNLKFVGIFQSRTPALMIRDPDLMKRILVKDFRHFQHRGLTVNEENDPLAAHLFNLRGNRWRTLRTTLTPTFTSGKMKMMFRLMEECSQMLKKYLSEASYKNQEIEIKEIVAKFTTDVIGTCAFGLQFNSLTDPESQFRKMGKRIFLPTISANLRRFTFAFLPGIVKLFKVKLIRKDVENFFLSVVKDTVEYRVKNGVRRNDFMQLLIDLKDKGKLEDDDESDQLSENHKEKSDEDFELTDGLLAAQAFIFFVAGFETSSSAISFCIHELAVNPDIQDKLRQEIDTVLSQTEGETTYDAIQRMEYLDKVVSETLRKYPSVPVLIRESSLPYTLPDTDITLERGTRVLIPVHAIHHDGNIYPDPERFDPERFDKENVRQRHSFTYLPFGEGPRVCIGMRFGLLQTKVGLVSLLSAYEFSVCSQTTIPLKMDPKNIISTSIGGIWVKISRRS